MKYALLASIALPALVGTAHAATITAASQVLPSFASIVAPTPSSGATDFATATADVTDGTGAVTAKSPFAGVSGYESAPFAYVLGGGSATFTKADNPTFVTGGDSFSFIFGSPDAFNTISFSLGGMEFASVTGDSPLFTTQQAGYYVTTVSGIGNYDAVRFSSTRNSIEFATYNVSSVPLPASLPMFGFGILGLAGAAVLRQRRAKASAAV